MKHHINLFRHALLAALLTTGGLTARAQSVGIGTTAPDASAALDIVSTNKGALLPRVAAVAAVANPATGLIVFQTGSPAGYYYNVGTPAAPNWQQLATASGAAITASNGLTKTGQNVALGGTLTQATTVVNGGFPLSVTGTGTTSFAGNVGIGTSNPAASELLDINGTARAIAVHTPPTGTTNMLPAAYGRIQYNGSVLSSSGNFTVTHPGNASYLITFTAASGLAGLDLTNLPCIGSVNYAAATCDCAGTPGALGSLSINIFDVSIGAPTGHSFSFVLYKP